MCRFVLYHGPEIRISSLVTEPANSSIPPSFHSHERSEPLNGYGFGIGWYVEEREEPAVFKDVSPAWSNHNLFNIAAATRTTCLLAHVRAASPGLSVQRLNCHPFAWRSLAFMHNGAVGGFATIRRKLLATLSDEAFNAIRGSTDSEHLFGVIIDEFMAANRSNGPLEAMEAAVRAAIDTTEGLREEAGVEEPSLLNLVATDGHRSVISRFISRNPERANTLYTHSGSRYVCKDGRCSMIPGSDDVVTVIVASEPLSDDEGWKPVPPNHLVLIDEDNSVAIREL